MAKKAYVGVNNVAKNISKMYVGVGNVAKKIKKAYVGVGDVAKLFFEESIPYTSKEYLQSSGSGQYIDSGIKGKGLTTDFEIEFEATRKTDYNFAFSARQSSSSNRFDLGWGGASSWFGYNTGSLSGLISNMAINTRYNIKKIGTQIFVNDTLSLTIAQLVDFTTPVNFYIFANNTNGTPANYGAFKLYKFKIYENNSLVRDFVPCLDSNNVACLFDKVTNEFFYNGGTGTFTTN